MSSIIKKSGSVNVADNARLQELIDLRAKLAAETAEIARRLNRAKENVFIEETVFKAPTGRIHPMMTFVRSRTETMPTKNKFNTTNLSVRDIGYVLDNLELCQAFYAKHKANLE